MHRPMPDLYAGELLTVTDEIYEQLPALARTTSPALITISNGHGAWAMALSNTLSRGDRVLVLECGVFARVWAEMAEFDGLEVEMMIADEGPPIDPAAVEARLRADTDAVDQGRADGADRHRFLGAQRRCRGAARARRRRPSGAADGRLHRLDGVRAVRDGRVGCRRHARRLAEGSDDAAGLGFVWAGPRALAAHKTADMRTRYWDWTFRLQEGPQYLRFCGTAPVSHIFGFREALRMIEEEGLEARWRRHAALAVGGAGGGRYVVGSGRALAVRPRARHRGDSVTTIATGAIDSAVLSEICARSVWGDARRRAARPRRSRVPHRPHGTRQRGLDPRRRWVSSRRPSWRWTRRSAARAWRPQRRRSGAASPDGLATQLPVVEPHGDLSSVAHPEFGEDVLHVVLGGSLRDERTRSAIC